MKMGAQMVQICIVESWMKRWRPGITVSVAAGNDGPDNEGLSGMGSSSLSITVGATDDQNTIERDDDTVASYSSRGQRKITEMATH